jgi:hypothetical protein
VIGFEEVAGQSVTLYHREKAKSAEPKIRTTVEKRTSIGENSKSRREKIGLEATLEKNVSDVRIAQVNVCFRVLVELDPLIMRSPESGQQELYGKMSSQPPRKPF